jgi:hypothetical protein
VAKRSKTPAPQPYVAEDPDELEGADLIAHEIVSERRDLLPSVAVIMEAELEDDTRTAAMGLFRDALGDLDDPNRDPRAAIANAG